MNAFRAGANRNPLGSEYRFDRGRHVFVFTRDEPRPFFDHRHHATETAIHLRELEADITAPDDDQVLRENVQLENRGVVQGWHPTDAGQVR